MEIEPELWDVNIYTIKTDYFSICMQPVNVIHSPDPPQTPATPSLGEGA